MEILMPKLDPSHIMQVGMGFFASKALLSAVELGLFTELAKREMTASEIANALDLNERAVPSGFSGAKETDPTASTQILLRAPRFLTTIVPTISVASWKWPTRGFTVSGQTSPRH
jgi:hypothetical protein